jgi:hypothetical protein
MVSIGVPEKGQRLIEHLEFDKGENYLFVDPENALYDALNLNFGIQRTFFNPSTPFSFLDRVTKEDGLKDLGTILSKWNKAVFIPPKQEQAFNQGGTFVFDGERAVFAHYDPSTAAHAPVDRVVEVIQSVLTRAGDKVAGGRQ